MLDPLIPTSIYVHAGDNGAIEVMGSRAKLPLLNITATSAAAFATLTTLQTKPDISVTVVDNSHLNTLNVNAFWTTVQVVETQFENLHVVSQQGWTDIDVAGAKTLWPMILNTTIKTEICLKSTNIIEPIEDQNVASNVQEFQFYPKGFYEDVDRRLLYTGYCSVYQYITDGKVQSEEYRVRGTGSCPSSYVESCHDTKGCFCSKTKDSCISWEFNKLYKTASALGYVTADSFESPANCIALCSSVETCVSFEVRSSDNRCAFSTT